MYYQQTYYKKNKQNKWEVKSSKPYYCNMPYGKWVQSAKIDEQNGDKTHLYATPTKSGLNMKVVKATTYFAGGKEKVCYDLITTGNKLPKKYFENRGKYKF